MPVNEQDSSHHSDLAFASDSGSKNFANAIIVLLYDDCESLSSPKWRKKRMNPEDMRY